MFRPHDFAKIMQNSLFNPFFTYSWKENFLALTAKSENFKLLMLIGLN